MTLPAVVVTGASGFVGRQLLDELKEDYRIFAIARRSQRECGAPVHPHIAWMQVDIKDRERLSRTFREIQTAGGAQFLFHFAAYYDFDGYPHEEYQLTNVEGTRNVLDLAGELGLKRLFFASSVAACKFPPAGSSLTEESPPDGDHIYAWSKRLGEEMVSDFSRNVPVSIIRFGAVFSDWAEYPPLYMLLESWLSNSWRSRILAGRGESAIPYIHIRDVAAFLRRLLQREAELGRCEVLIASTDRSTSHAELFARATKFFFGSERQPRKIPKWFAAAGLILMNFWGKLIGQPPFEKTWMRRYIDLQLNVGNSETRKRLNWNPDPRLRIEKRLLFLVERLKSDPQIWHARNLAAMRRTTFRPELVIYERLSQAEHEAVSELVQALRAPLNAELFSHFAALEESELQWLVKLMYRLLLTSVQSSNRLLLLNYLQVTELHRFETGFTGEEMSRFLEQLQEIAFAKVIDVEQLKGQSQSLFDCIALPIQMARDEIMIAYSLYQQNELLPPTPEPKVEGGVISPREMLEETIWQCLVQRK